MLKYFVCLIVSKFCPLILKLRLLTFSLFFVQNKIISALVVFKNILFAQSHWTNNERSWGDSMSMRDSQSPILSDFDQILPKCSYLVETKVRKIFSPNSKRFLRDIGFWNLGNFRAFFQKSTILNFPYLMKLS